MSGPALELSIVIPAYNEDLRLPTSLGQIASYIHASGHQTEVIVVDDGSNDRTAAIAESFRSQMPALRVISNGENRGKGYSVRHGMLDARGCIVLFTDADLSAPIEEADKLLAALENYDIAIGSRALDRSLIGVHQSRWREASGIFFNRVMRVVTGLPFADTQCGFKLYRRDAARAVFPLQRLDGFGFDVEDLYIARIWHIPAIEVPVRWNNVEGTKVSLMHGLRSFSDLLLVRWNHLRGRYR